VACTKEQDRSPRIPRTLRTLRIWILNYSLKARPLTELTRDNTPFEWTPRRQEAFDTLKEAISTPPVLRPIDYTSDQPVVLSVDSCPTCHRHYPFTIRRNRSQTSSTIWIPPMNERRHVTVNPKLELYGLYRALRHFRLYNIGVKTSLLKSTPSISRRCSTIPTFSPIAVINRWIGGILTFTFKLVHVPSKNFKGTDGLSR